MSPKTPRRAHLERLNSIGLFGLPFATAAVVGLALFGGGPRVYRTARVFGGTTENLSALAVRIEVVSRVFEIESPVTEGKVEVSALATTGDRVHGPGVLDAFGVVDVSLPFTRPNPGPLWIEVRDSASEAILARGAVTLPRARWLLSVRRRGGWIAAKTSLPLRVRVAAARGAFVVPFADRLLIAVDRAGQPLAGARVQVEPDGARLDPAGELVTDARGRAQVSLIALEHTAAVRVRVEAPDGSRGQIESPLPIVPGGMRATLEGSALVVQSPVERDRAYFSFWTEAGRVGGGAIELRPDGHGSALGRLEHPAAPSAGWVVASSRVDETSTAVVGWPLQVADEPQTTFDVAETLLLDGAPLVFARERARRSRIRWLTASFSVVALGLTALLFRARVRAAERDIARHFTQRLSRDESAELAPKAALGLVAALLALALGFIALSLVVTLRLG